MEFKRVKQETLRFTGNILLPKSVDLLCKSLKINFVNRESVAKLEKEGQNYVVAFWHGSMLLPWYLHKGKNSVALISRSKDGDLLAKALRNWDYTVIRGSSSKGGDIALGIMIDYARNNYNIAVTPDGPRGPKQQFKAGAVVAAKKSGIPLILAGVGYQKKTKLKSWDSFAIPHPFSRVKVVYSEPVLIDKILTYDQTGEVIKFCEKELLRLQKEAEQF
jgi:lysophospholipid acyltransferase (LPLAT)-like uncharacterized protein